MHSKLAGHLPLQSMIADVLNGAREKLAAAEEKKEEKKAPPFAKKEEKKEEEKKASALIFHDADEVVKLAEALEEAAEELVKEADSIENGGESKQGGEQLATQSPTGGKQPYSKDGSKKHQIPAPTTTKGTKDNPGSSEAMKTDDGRAPGGNGAKYPEKGVLKTAEFPPKKDEEKKEEKPAFPPKKDEKGEEKKEDDKKEKKSASEVILAKIAEFKGGGEQTPTDEHKAPGYGSAKIPAEGAKLSNKDNIKNITKREAKAPRKAELAQVLTEPAFTKSTDNKVHENLRNAAKGGVKIAAAKALLQKIASEGCKCEGKGSCPHCKLAAAVERKKGEKKSE